MKKWIIRKRDNSLSTETIFFLLNINKNKEFCCKNLKNLKKIKKCLNGKMKKKILNNNCHNILKKTKNSKSISLFLKTFFLIKNQLFFTLYYNTLLFTNPLYSKKTTLLIEKLLQRKSINKLTRIVMTLYLKKPKLNNK
jgi:hypothetical protein